MPFTPSPATLVIAGPDPLDGTWGRTESGIVWTFPYPPTKIFGIYSAFGGNVIDGAELPPTNIWISDVTLAASLNANASSTTGPLTATAQCNAGQVSDGSAFRTTSIGEKTRAELFAPDGLYSVQTRVTLINPYGPLGGPNLATDFNATASVVDFEAVATYEEIGPPVQNSISPSSGSTAGGTLVHIFGTGFMHFDENTQHSTANNPPDVTFGGVPATSVVWVSATEITCVTPAHVAGAVTVVVTNPDGQFCTKLLFYTYTPPLFAMDQMVVEVVYAARFTAALDPRTDGWFPPPAPGGDPPGRIGGGIRRPLIVNGQWQIHRLDFKPNGGQSG